MLNHRNFRVVHIAPIFRILPLLFIFCQVDAQYYSLGQDPASIRWRQINTDHFRIIYPENFEGNAQYLTNLFEFVYKHGTTSLNHRPAKVPVIIHNRDITPNAFSIWAPKRVELFSCPPQNSYAQKWLEQLAIHEYRHVVQMDMLNKGFTRGLGWLFGQQAPAAITGLFVPMWFMEGDAVCAETALSHSGRGRIPSFEMEIRTQLLEKKLYSYDKAVYGSYRDFVPDQYVLGYQIVANTRKKFGAGAWISTMDMVARRPFILTPFSHGLKKSTGMNKTSLYRSVFHEMDSLWKSQRQQTVLTPYRRLSKPNPREYVQYKHPHYINDSLILAERTGMGDISRFVLVNRSGQERILHTPGYFSSEVFSVNTGTGAAGSMSNKPGAFTADNLSLEHGMLAWTEREADPRWQNRNYSVIRLFDFTTGKVRTLTHRSRYFSPAIAPDGSGIVAVKIGEDNHSSLVIIDPLTGSEKDSLIGSADDAFMTPSWSPDNRKIVYIRLSQHGKSIEQFHLTTGRLDCILKPSFMEVSNPVYAGQYILFNGSFSGIDNIYAMDTLDGSLFQVTSSAYGAFNAQYNPSGNAIVYSDYHATGYQLAEADFNPGSWIPFHEVKKHSADLYKYLLPEETGIMDSTSISTNTYQSSPYKKSRNLFNFHSWAPLYFNYASSENSAGFTLYSQNLLSTATTTIGYLWDYPESSGRFKLGFLWEAWYPVFEINASTGNRTSYSSEKETRYHWNETAISGGIRLPLQFSRGQYFSGIRASANINWLNISRNTRPDTVGFEGNLGSLDYRLLIFHYRKQAIKDLYPAWGQVLECNFRHSPFSERSYGTNLSLESILYFPGLARHHGIKTYAGIQWRKQGDYSFADQVNLARGYYSMMSERMLSLSFNYKFPFLYPDVSIGPLAYLKRFKALFFYDHCMMVDSNTLHLNSTGMELTSDMHLLRFLLPIDMGIRSGYRFNDRKWFADFLFSVNLSF